MRAILTRTTRMIAMALNEQTLREFVYREMRKSPYREGKLNLQPFLVEEGDRLAAGMAAQRSGTTQGAVRRSLDSLVNLEFYMPVAAHRKRWQPDQELIVVFMVRDVDETVVGFDLRGNRLLLSPFEIPATAMLSVVPAETDFSAPPGVRPVVYGDECEPDTDDCGGGGGGTPTQYSGIVMLEWKIRDKTWDPAPFGAPEFEATIIDDIAVGGGPAPGATWNCAAEGWGTSDIPRWWNYDDDGTLETGQKRILDDDELDDLNTFTPRVIVSEDDGQSCNSGHFPSVGNPDPLLNNDDPVGDFFYTINNSATTHSDGDLLHLKLRSQ